MPTITLQKTKWGPVVIDANEELILKLIQNDLDFSALLLDHRRGARIATSDPIAGLKEKRESAKDLVLARARRFKHAFGPRDILSSTSLSYSSVQKSLNTLVEEKELQSLSRGIYLLAGLDPTEVPLPVKKTAASRRRGGRLTALELVMGYAGRTEEFSQKELRAALNLAVPTISKALKILTDGNKLQKLARGRYSKA